MNILNTMPSIKADPLERALFLLNTLTQEDNRAVVDYLVENGNADFLELLVHTGMDSSELETQLELLCEADLLICRSAVTKEQYELNKRQVQKLAELGGKLAGDNSEPFSTY